MANGMPGTPKQAHTQKSFSGRNELAMKQSVAPESVSECTPRAGGGEIV